jgi:hypothetical protein
MLGLFEQVLDPGEVVLVCSALLVQNVVCVGRPSLVRCKWNSLCEFRRRDGRATGRCECSEIQHPS